MGLEESEEEQKREEENLDQREQGYMRGIEIRMQWMSHRHIGGCVHPISIYIEVKSMFSSNDGIGTRNHHLHIESNNPYDRIGCAMNRMRFAWQTGNGSDTSNGLVLIRRLESG